MRTSRWISLGGAVLLAAFIAVTGSATSTGGDGGGGGPGPGQDVHHFKIEISSNGSTTVDYGRDRETQPPEQCSASGVDGKLNMTWSWRIRAVGTAVGDGSLRSTYTNFRGSATNGVEELVVWGIQNCQRPAGVTPLCNTGGGVPGYSYSSHPGADETGQTPKPTWVGSEFTDVRLTGRGFKISIFPYQELTGSQCYHGLAEGTFYSGSVEPNEAAVPRGAFNPRSDPSYNKTFPGAPTEEAQALHGSDINALHTTSGSSELTIEIDSITQKAAEKLENRYRKPLQGDVDFLPTFQPAPAQ